MLSALNPICCGAGAEVDRPLRDMPVILSALTGGGYRLRVEASSPGWSINASHQHSAAPIATGGAKELSLCSAGGMEVKVSVDPLVLLAVLLGLPRELLRSLFG